MKRQKHRTMIPLANDGIQHKERGHMFPFFVQPEKADRSVLTRFMKISDTSIQATVIRKRPNDWKGRSEYVAKCLYL